MLQNSRRLGSEKRLDDSIDGAIAQFDRGVGDERFALACSRRLTIP